MNDIVHDYNKGDKPYEFRRFKDQGAVSHPNFITGGYKTQSERVNEAVKRNQETTFLEAFDPKSKRHAIEDKVCAHSPSMSLPDMKYTHKVTMDRIKDTLKYND